MRHGTSQDPKTERGYMKTQLLGEKTFRDTKGWDGNWGDFVKKNIKGVGPELSSRDVAVDFKDRWYDLLFSGMVLMAETERKNK